MNNSGYETNQYLPNYWEHHYGYSHAQNYSNYEGDHQYFYSQGPMHQNYWPYYPENNNVAHHQNFQDQYPDAQQQMPQQPRLDNVQNSSVGPIRNGRRRRTPFTSYQLSVLEAEFRICKYIDRVRREELARYLNVNPDKIRTWYRNQRYKASKDSIPPPNLDATITADLKATDGLMKVTPNETREEYIFSPGEILDELATIVSPEANYAFLEQHSLISTNEEEACCENLTNEEIEDIFKQLETNEETTDADVQDYSEEQLWEDLIAFTNNL